MPVDEIYPVLHDEIRAIYESPAVLPEAPIPKVKVPDRFPKPRKTGTEPAEPEPDPLAEYKEELKEYTRQINAYKELFKKLSDKLKTVDFAR